MSAHERSRHREPSHSYRSETRSASPDRHHHHRRRHHRDRDSRSRSLERSSKRSRHHHHHHHHRRHDRPSEETPAAAAAPAELPFGTRQLSKRDLPLFEPMLAMYLDIQKGLILEDMNEAEVKGRWKSFVGKWNRGELAEGWYDPSTLEKARRSVAEDPLPSRDTDRRRVSPDYERGGRNGRPRRTEEEEEDTRQSNEEDEDEDEDYGPKLPHPDMSVVSGDRTGPRPGPTIPNTQDLELRRESAIADSISAREDQRKQHRAEIQSHRTEIRQIVDEIAPRAEPGTHERRMEKRREAAAANREFAQNARGGSPVEAVPEADLIGGGENDLDSLKKVREREQRKKNERELRREEMLRARAAEREERQRKYQQKEEETMSWLKALAKQRFG